MAKLTNLAPTLGRLSPTLQRNLPQEQTRSAQRYATTPWRKWYGLKRWKDLRWQVIIDACLTCKRCGTFVGDTSKLVADHVIPHRGRASLFWDIKNVQCICEACHSTVKQREEQSELPGVWD